MAKKTLKSITVRRLIGTFSLLIILVLIITVLGYHQIFKLGIEGKAREISNLVKAGLTSHMKAQIMDKREYFLDEIVQLNNISSLHIIRSQIVQNQFGHSDLKQELNNVDLTKKIVDKSAYFQWNYVDKKVTALIPYIASSKGKLDCLQCHNAKENDILGAIELEIDISKYQSIMLNHAFLITALLILVALVILLNMFHFIEHYLRKPLFNIIHDAECAYTSHDSLDNKNYEIEELKQLAQNINRFNQDIIKKEKALVQKNSELFSLNEEIESTLKETIMSMGNMEELRSKDTKNHTLRVSKLSALIAREYGLSEHDVKLIELASPLHDIGKVGIPDSILLKPAKLSEDEFTVMMTHSGLGYDVLKHSKREVLQAAATIAHTHHEKYDGSGYPQGLQGDKIPLFGRIVAIVDVLDALVSKRIYKDPWPIDKIEALFKEESAKAFEPKLVEIVLKNLEIYIQFIHKLTK